MPLLPATDDECRHECSSSSFPGQQSSLEYQPQTDLNVSRQIVLSRHLTEVRTGWIGVRVAKLRMVEGVEKLTAQLELYPLSDRKVLDHRQIPQVQRLPPKLGNPRWECPYIVHQSNALVGALFGRIHNPVRLNRGIAKVKTANIKGSVDGVAGDGGSKTAGVAVEIDIAASEVYWASALILIDALELPAADKGVDEAVRIRAEAAAPAKRQLPYSTHYYSVRNVAFPDASLVVGIRLVEEGHLLHRFRPGITRQQGESPGETPLNPELTGVINRLAVVAPRANSTELRKWAQQLLPLDRGTVETRPRQ